MSRADENPHVLRERFQRWGYLFFPGYLSNPTSEALLSTLLEQATPHVSRNAAGAPELRGEPFVECDPVWDEVYPRIQSLETFHEFFHQPRLLDLMRSVTGREAFVYPMKMARISTPGKEGFETPPHQDAYSHHAGNTMAGIWIALHAVDKTLGRLKVLPGSHSRGVRPVFATPGVGGVQCEIYPDERQWHVSDVEGGDVLIFHACTVHKAEPNLSETGVRISVDTRFCDRGAPVFSTNLEPHHGWRINGLNWQNIYRGWQDKRLQYYWRDYPNLF
ncbi:MAG: phytanoyl-CoA dioxygenase family protein [Halioglobus sp.]